MAMRTVSSRINRLMITASRSSKMEGFGGIISSRYFSDEKGRILSEEERAKETVYIQKMERERLEKLKKKKEKEKAEAEKRTGQPQNG